MLILYFKNYQTIKFTWICRNNWVVFSLFRQLYFISKFQITINLRPWISHWYFNFIFICAIIVISIAVKCYCIWTYQSSTDIQCSVLYSIFWWFCIQFCVPIFETGWQLIQSDIADLNYCAICIQCQNRTKTSGRTEDWMPAALSLSSWLCGYTVLRFYSQQN